MSGELENRLESWEQLARESVAEFEDARGYASSYFTEKWGYDETSRRFAETIERLASLRARPQEPDELQKLVDEQAEDEGLWCEAANIVEAYLQQELRRLHAAIENRPALREERE